MKNKNQAVRIHLA